MLLAIFYPRGQYTYQYPQASLPVIIITMKMDGILSEVDPYYSGFSHQKTTYFCANWIF
jgi:hypothetical protein